jgi:hypothetical protein
MSALEQSDVFSGIVRERLVTDPPPTA